MRFRQEIWLPAQPVVVARRREREEWLGPSYFFIPLVLGLLNSLTEGASPRKSMAPTKLRLRECTFSVVVTE